MKFWQLIQKLKNNVLKIFFFVIYPIGCKQLLVCDANFTQIISLGLNFLILKLKRWEVASKSISIFTLDEFIQRYDKKCRDSVTFTYFLLSYWWDFMLISHSLLSSYTFHVGFLLIKFSPLKFLLSSAQHKT